ncbi:isoleucine--tRNA ligase [Lactobacillus sp. CC-MHH1034]|uniref:isoleucine--tRNA ligase n=1 Tax=Agrilactobacillus fermenti TaxID=2586909 RepID=UPI001E62BAFC|nr:isoleucine--tRNA ligase [Agrilactobacillus fermenti]MCD2255304.1 isoleucine--tRNA ligase [Agrilactobacillus fermenti]
MRVKDTLNLGKTKFPMRGNLPNKEPERQKAWYENEVYEQRQKLNEGKPTFILHDGPPFANGNIHMGHALNKISKDIIVRYKSMHGFRAPYVPGWDTHGLPIEQELTKQGVDRKSMSMAEYRELCRQYAMSQIDKQRSDFKRLGVAGDWNHPYITLQHEYEAEQIRVFGKMADKGYIYKGKKPVYWSPSSESTLAEAEIEYKDVKSPSIYVAFKVVDGKDLLDTDTAFIIWTTTPWTMPANLAIAANPKFNYIQVEADGKKYVIAESLLERVKEALGWTHTQVLQTFKGTELEYMTAQHPFYDRTSLLILGNHVTLDEGTGLVHTAPGHGTDDFFVGQKYHLPPLSPVDEQGRFTKEAPGFEGMFYDDANKEITKLLDEKGALLKLSFFTHSYPHDWRTKKPVIFRATTQWFASVAAFRDNLLKAVEGVSYKPYWGKTRLYNMIKDRGDWVISRQRAWGVPLPIFYAENGDAIITDETINHVADLFAKYGSNIWFQREAKELLPEGFTYPGSPNGKFTKENDIMDVWFDSGSSHQAVLKQRPELSFPADLYLEGSDQYRGWFNSSLITSVAVTGQAPYRQILSQGFTLDDKGRKMSKSLGNVISPNDVIKQMGADIVRLWVSSVDTNSDVAVSMDIFRQTSESYRKIRNTIRFMLANTSDYEPKTDRVAYADLSSVDRYMMVRLNQVIKTCLDAYDQYDFATVFKTISNFLTNDLSSFYLDFAKDVVYIEAADDIKRRRMQTVMYDVVVALTKLLTPIIPHTTEEIWSFLKEPEAFVQLAEMPEPEIFADQDALLSEWSNFMTFRDNVLKALEVARDNKVIGKSLEAYVTVYPTTPVKDLLTTIDNDVKQMLIVSKLTVAGSKSEAPADAMDFEDVAIKVEHAPGEVCQRCRMTREDVGQDPQLPNICARCAKILHEHFADAVKAGLEP